jgi:two-component system, cell cycle response regulator DivK
MFKVLIADDAAASRELIGTILESTGYEVAEAQDGAEALQSALAQRPDLIILDIQMPLLDGYAVLKALRTHPVLRSIPVVALTAGAMQDERQRALAAGFDLFITKPISIADLRVEVGRLLGCDPGRGIARSASGEK